MFLLPWPFHERVFISIHLKVFQYQLNSFLERILPIKTVKRYDTSEFVYMLCVLTADPILVTRPILPFLNWLILLAKKNGDCPAISVPQNGSDAQEAPNLLNQAKVCHFQPIEI